MRNLLNVRWRVNLLFIMVEAMSSCLVNTAQLITNADKKLFKPLLAPVYYELRTNINN